MVDVKWFGHCCFEVKGGEVTVLCDPHDGTSLGLPVPISNPDVVLISHPHDDHANGRKLFENSIILDSPCHEHVKDSEITGIEAYHDDVKGSRMGVNVFFKFTVDGISYGHTGDLGHILEEWQLAQIGKIDILFSGVGSSSQANIELLKPRVVIPMHYHIEGIIFPWFKMPEVDDYVKDKPHRKLGNNTYKYTQESLPETLEYHVYEIR